MLRLQFVVDGRERVHFLFVNGCHHDMEIDVSYYNAVFNLELDV